MRRQTMLILALLAFGPAAAQTGDGPLLGMWGYHSEFPVGLSGTLTVRQEGPHWVAELAGTKAETTAPANAIRFAFPNGGGMFRGDLRSGKLQGYWVRREMTDDPRFPYGTTQAYTMPLAFTRAGSNSWRATVAPLTDPFTLYLKISRDPGGKLVAAFRDPEQNSHGPAMQLLVTQQGNAVRFSTWPDQHPEGHLDGTLTSQGIEIFWEDIKRNIVLRRLDAAEAAPFYARPPGSAPYVYRQPEETGDGWKTARADALGMDEAAIAKIVQNIIDIDPAAKRHAFQIHSIAIAYKGKLVLDEYFHGFTRDRPHDMRSASKTFAAVMFGTAMLHGARISPQTKAYTLLAPLGPFANPDPRKSEITLADFLTHTPGLDCDDNNDDDPNNEDHMEAQRAQLDWRKFTLDLRAIYTPGTHYAYCSGDTNVVGGAISIATGTWLPQWFDKTVARPLQFGSWYWNVMPNGEGYLGGGAFVRTRDFLKLGQTWLDGGVWNGRRIVSAAWVKDSISPHRRISPETTGRYGDAFAEVYGEGYDGYAWHLTDVQSNGRAWHAYYANGAGGQLLIVVPGLNLACMFTAGNYGQGIWLYLRDDIVGKEIIPAVHG